MEHTDQAARHLTWHKGAVDKADRYRLTGHRGGVVWLTGLSGSGKSTLASALDRRLNELQIRSYVLDGDNLRHGLNRDLGFSPEDRKENIRRVGEVAALFADAGLIAVAAFISPYAADRDMVRALLPAEAFMEVHVSCPLEVCESRDPKGLYRKARAGVIAEFTGVSSPYEPPQHPELTLATDRLTMEACVEELVAELRRRGWIAIEPAEEPKA